MTSKTELRAKWLSDLRSGEFQQCRYSLMNREDEFCCLGVAAVTLGIFTKTGNEPDEQTSEFAYNTVRDDLGFTPDGFGQCMTMNDSHKKTFIEIANAIEKYPSYFFHHETVEPTS